MSFESGSTSLMICPLSGELPEDFLERLAKYSAGKLDDVKEDPVIGWVSGRHLLETEISENTSICGGHLYVNLRKAERKIPAQLLNAICRREELAYMMANDTLTVPRSEKRRIKEDAVERNLMKMPPNISATAMVVDRTAQVMYLACSSASQFDVFAAEFVRALEVEPVPLSPNELMLKLFQKSETDLPALSFTSKSGAEDEAMPGRDFLTWLWFYSEQNLGVLKLADLGEFTIALEGPLTFAFSNGKSKDPDLSGAGESVVKKGNPLTSAEAKAALAVGKKLKKAKIMIARGDAEKWTFGFDADTFALSGLNLPEGEEMERHSRFQERVTNLGILHQVLCGYFELFAKSLQGDRLKKTQEAIRLWTKERESL